MSTKRSLTTRYNAQARQSSPRKRRKLNHVSDGDDANATIHIPKPQDQRKAEQKERMVAQLRAEQSVSKWNKRKQIRLEKYIDKKLGDEEKQDLLHKLKRSQASLDTSQLVSSSLLGQGKKISAHKSTHVDSDDEDNDEDNDDDNDEILPIPPAAQVVVGSGLRHFAGWKARTQDSPSLDDHSDFDSSDSANDSSSEDEVQPKKRSLGFKAWATAQLNQVKADAPNINELHSPVLPALPLPPAERSPTTLKVGPLGSSYSPQSLFSARALDSTKHDSIRPVISRSQEVQESRLQLPILAMEQEIVECVLLNRVVVIQGETGSGKTTQVPQMLYEAGFGFDGSENPGLIGITQPRRVAAVAMANRVAEEMALPINSADTKTQPRKLVGYQIRYASTIHPLTRIKFMTDGVLLREVMGDFMLHKYSVIVIDEAHERSLNSDLLVGVLSRIVDLRDKGWKEGKCKPLRIIIMSASSLSSIFSGSSTTSPTPGPTLFTPEPPLITVSGRTHPVSVHFSKRTKSDYVQEVVKKVSKIHTRLPQGGILVFLTGMEEILGVMRLLENRFTFDGKMRHEKVKEVGRPSAAKLDVEIEDIELTSTVRMSEVNIENTEEFDEVEDPEALDTEEEEEEDEREEEERQLDNELGLPTPLALTMTSFQREDKIAPLYVLPLHSLLSQEEQSKVFLPVPEGYRLCVLATNVAETSLTIPGIRYVVDSGRAKERHFDPQTGLTTYPINFISKSSALQRSGRAGRTGPGHCYRLYSSALFENHFDKDRKAEIKTTPLEAVLLLMKALGIPNLDTFPWIEAPDPVAMRKAEGVLVRLGALETPVLSTSLTKITNLGKTMSLFPVSLRHARMLVSAKLSANQGGSVIPYVVCLVAAGSVGDPFVLPGTGIPSRKSEYNSQKTTSGTDSDGEKDNETLGKERKAVWGLLDTHSSLGGYTSDFFRLLSVVGAYEYAGGGREWCQRNFVRFKAMQEIHKFRAQLARIVQANFDLNLEDAGFTDKLAPPTDLQLKVLRQLICSSSLDRVAFRADLVSSEMSKKKYATSQGVPYKIPSISLDQGLPKEEVYIHHSSVVADRPPPDYVVFEELVEGRTGKKWIKGLSFLAFLES
ncbi:P-loop containing nucleoside triphosphate hydrolase protein [Flagelloscypha sp. PMI_526]|nr:P-loop containing nucleoside triphosphate hydrolase protein [Flagelloscypha sp. PMI_526]